MIVDFPIPDRVKFLLPGSKKRGCTSSSRIFKMTVIVYDNKNLHITELEDTRPVIILFYFIYQ
jgi:hypothetical protein